MKKCLFLTGILLTLLTVNSFAQWPGYFYGFQLLDENGKNIDSTNTGFKMKTVLCKECDGLILSIKECDDKLTWRFYAGGNKNLEKTNGLEIDKIADGEVSETMTIEFPASMTGGTNPYYANLYIGTLKFRKGKYSVKFPKTAEEWDSLKELKICQLSYMDVTFLDISEYQNEK
jgi:hypothetical protein